jgi:hypothetical protein
MLKDKRENLQKILRREILLDGCISITKNTNLCVIKFDFFSIGSGVVLSLYLKK